MALKRKLITTLVAGALAAAATSASAVPFTGVIVFGDSLSDAGAYRPGLTALVGAQAAAGLGRFTTNPGPVWAELIAQTYGGNAAPFNAGGTNYAQGGMRVALPSPASKATPLREAQVLSLCVPCVPPGIVSLMRTGNLSLSGASDIQGSLSPGRGWGRQGWRAVAQPSRGSCGAGLLSPGIKRDVSRRGPATRSGHKKNQLHEPLAGCCK